jgi:hypothetical protein
MILWSYKEDDVEYVIHRNAEFTNFLRTVLYQENTAAFYDTPVEILWVDAVIRLLVMPEAPYSLWKPFLLSRLKNE